MTSPFDNDDERAAIRALVATLYSSISGPAGAPRDWDAQNALFLDDGRLLVFHEGAAAVDVFTTETYQASRTPLLAKTSFYEDEVRHDVAIAGRFAHVFSHYEARREVGGATIAAGVNSIQLVRTPAGWKVLSIAWEYTGTGSAPES